jgi:2'-5' RNA ligase
METNLFQMPGYRVSEYLLVLDVPEILRHKIEKVKAELLEKYLIPQPSTGRPHVALVRFVMPEMMEEKLVYRMQVIALAEKPFLIELKDYGSYPMHSIYINIANQQRVLQLIKNLKETRRLMKSGGEDPHFLQDPTIPLAGRMDKKVYVEAMKEYAHKHFTGKFVADAMLLLKRKSGEKKYQVLKRFDFQNLPVNVAQGNLFASLSPEGE